MAVAGSVMAKTRTVIRTVGLQVEVIFLPFVPYYARAGERVKPICFPTLAGKSPVKDGAPEAPGHTSRPPR